MKKITNANVLVLLSQTFCISKRGGAIIRRGAKITRKYGIAPNGQIIWPCLKQHHLQITLGSGIFFSSFFWFFFTSVLIVYSILQRHFQSSLSVVSCLRFYPPMKGPWPVKGQPISKLIQQTLVDSTTDNSDNFLFGQFLQTHSLC